MKQPEWVPTFNVPHNPSNNSSFWEVVLSVALTFYMYTKCALSIIDQLFMENAIFLVAFVFGWY